MADNTPSPFTGTLPTGEDIEGALDIIDANGGTGEWEEADAETEVQRWLFPRFDGATDPGHMYLSRPGLGGRDTDVETIADWLNAPRTIVGMILVVGDPGCGKTALIEAAACHSEREVVTHLCTPDDTRESLMLKFVGEGNGENGTPFVKGPLSRAAESGALFYGDEFMLIPDGVKPIFFELADGRQFLSGGNVDGTDIEIHENFRLIVSSNPLVRGASLPEPIGSRAAGTTLTVETSASLLRDLAIDESVVEAWQALKTAGLWHPQVRELRVADYWLSVDPSQSVSAFLPEHCPESQRKQVKDVVVSYLGGQIRDDGRLVVA